MEASTSHPARAVPRPAWSRRYRLAAIASDSLVALLAVLGFFAWPSGSALSVTALAVGVSIPLLWVTVLAVVGAYAGRGIGVGPDEYRNVGRAAVLLVSVLALVSVVLDLRLPAQFITVVGPLTLVGTLASRRTLRHRLGRARVAGAALSRTVVVGRGLAVAELIREIQANPVSSGLDVVGACVADLGDLTDLGTSVRGVPILGSPDTALQAVDELGADSVLVLSHPELGGRSLRRLGWALADRSVDLLVAPGIDEVAAPRVSLQPRAGLTLLHVERPIMSGVKLAVKRATDAVLAFALIVAALPPMLLIAFLVWWHDKGPVFYRQERVGERGETFRMYKFRSMVVDADERLARGELAHLDQVNSKLFKSPDDPRITRVGLFLRKYSLDELPQLINVIRGEMSLVGPRPPLRREVATYEPDESQRLRVRPGMTGLWQISGRSDLTWEESVRLDLYYVDNWTPLVDLQILFRTGRAVFAGQGAY